MRPSGNVSTTVQLVCGPWASPNLKDYSTDWLGQLLLPEIQRQQKLARKSGFGPTPPLRSRTSTKHSTPLDPDRTFRRPAGSFGRTDILGDHPKAAIGYQFKTGHRGTA